MTDQYRFNGCRFDGSDGRLIGSDADQAISLRPQVGRLLERFLVSPGQVLDRDTLCQAVWSDGSVVDFESGLAALLRELRQALDQVGAGADLIETVPRRGYRFHGRPEPFAGSRFDVPGQTETRAGRSGDWRVAAGRCTVGRAGSRETRSGSAGHCTGAGNPAFRSVIRMMGTDSERLSLLLADTVLARLWDAELDQTGADRQGRTRAVPGQGGMSPKRSRTVWEVELLLEGTVVTEAAGQWRIEARLLHMPRGTILWSSTLDWTDQAELPLSEAAARLVEQLGTDWVSVQQSRLES